MPTSSLIRPSSAGSDLENEPARVSDPISTRRSFDVLEFDQEKSSRSVAQLPERCRERLDAEASKRIHELRSRSPGFVLVQSIVQTIKNDLMNKGTLLTDGRESYFKASCLPWPIPFKEEDRFLQQVLSNYSVAPGDNTYRSVVTELRLFALQEGRRVAMKQLSFYDKKSGLLYVSNQGQRVFRITASEIEEVENGSDGVLFYEPDNCELNPVRFIEDPETVDDFLLYMVEQINFEGSAEDVAHQKMLLEIYMYSLFFPELMETRAILMLIGEPGSRKSFTLTKLGRMLCGDHFHVTPMPGDPKSFDAIVTNASFVAFDDAEAHHSWLDDKLAVCATGGEVAGREYYTTNKLAKFPIIARIALSAHSPKFRRGDISDRALILKLSRIESFKSGTDLSDDFSRKRPRIYTGLLYLLQGVVSALSKTHDFLYEGTFRMADFASFALRIGLARDEREQVQEALDWVILGQRGFTNEEHPLLAFLEVWVEKTGGTTDPLTTAELFAELSDFAAAHHLSFNKACSNAISLGRTLVGFSRWEASPIVISYKDGRSRTKLWTISAADKPPVSSPTSSTFTNEDAL